MKTNVSPQKQLSPVKISNEAETMLNDLESSLAQFLSHNNTNNSVNLSRPSITDDELCRKSLPKLRSINNMNNDQNENNDEPSMRVEWLDDAMQAERRKIVDEDEFNVNSQQSSGSRQKRPLVDSNFDQSLNRKKSRT